MNTRSTLICGIALASVALMATGCSKKKSTHSASTVASSTSSSTTVITSSSKGTISSQSTAPTTTSAAAPPLANTGSGTFIDGSASIPTSTSDDFGVVAGDFDGDGDTDLAIVSHADPESRILENDGGNFTIKAGAFPVLAMRATDVHASDLDKDGDLDLVVASNMEPIRVFKNDGRGVFTLSGSFVTNNDTFTYGITLADFDGDGYDDVFMANAGLNAPSSGQNRLLINDTSGAFKEAAAGSVPARDDDSIGIAALDFDRDGDLDVFVSNFGSSHRLLVNDGQAVFTDGSDTYLPPSISYGTSVEVADFNQDGYPDVLIGNEGAPSASAPPQGEQNSLLLGSLGGVFSDASATLPQLSDVSFDLIVLDANGDGAPDLALGNLRGVQGLFLNVNGQLVDATPNLPSTNVPGDCIGCTSADFNGDRAPDLIFLQRRDTPKVFLNVPQGAPASTAPAATNSNLSPI